MADELNEPARLGPRGAKLWRDVTESYDLAEKPAELELLAEACRITDRLEKLDELLAGGTEEWTRVRVPRSDSDDQVMILMIDGALAEARQQQNILKQVVAALRLPDEVSGKRPQRRGARGAYQPKGAGSGTVTALERARMARGGA